MVKQKTFKIVTLGCRANQYESQAYRDQLESLGYIPAENDESADLCILNTCTVTESADAKSRYQIRNIIRQNPNAEIYITGCLANNDLEGLKKIDGVTGVVNNEEKEHLLSKVFAEDIKLPEFAIKNFSGRNRAFIKVQDGCNSFCTYCIIPYVRGRSRSRNSEEIILEIEKLIDNGYCEIVLTGINIGDFDDGKNRLVDLVRLIDNLPGLERLRISSLDPNDIDDDFIDAICNGKHTCHSLHLVLQSGSDKILKHMNRKYTRSNFLNVVSKFRERDPDFTFSTDVIVGFPGEDDVDLQDSIDIIETVMFSKVHIFPFSPRKGTAAEKYQNRVPVNIIKERKEALLAASKKYEFIWRERFVGKKVTVLTEDRDPENNGIIRGHTDQFINIELHDKYIGSNLIIDVSVIRNDDSCLIGEFRHEN